MRFGIVSDIHLAPPGHPEEAWHNPLALETAMERFRRALAWCAEAGVDGIVVLGDVAHLGDEALLTAGVEAAAATGLPVWMVPGNHDVLVRNDALARAISQAGAGNVHFAPAAGAQHSGITIAGVGLAGDASSGGLSAAALDTSAWGDDLVILASHFPMLPLRDRTEAAGLKYAGDLVGLAEAAAPVLSRAAPTIVVHGHLHLGHAEARGALLQVSCAALVEPPFAVNLLQIDQQDGQIRVHHVESSISPVPDVPLPRVSGANRRWVFSDGTWREESPESFG